MPRNVILLLGDGMGQEHWDAARMRAGRPLAVDGMRGPVFYTTSSTGDVVTDSAASATAMATGHCTLNGRLGLSAEGEPLETLLELAQRSRKQTGLVTNSYVIDASPMAFAVHVASRALYGDITEQLLTVTKPDLVFGGWIPPELLSPRPSIEQTASSNGYAVAYDMTEASMAPARAPLLGLFGLGPSSPSWPVWEWGLTPDSLRSASSNEPTLEEMARFALERLGAAPEGFLLLVESELADTIGHNSLADPTLAVSLMPDAVLELDRAIGAVVEWTLAESTPTETLVLVWSDHETGYYSVPDGGPSAATFSTSSHTATPVPAYTLDPRLPMLEEIRHVTDLHAFVTETLARKDAGSSCP